MTWSASDIPSQRGRVAVVTGTGGLGIETALALARAGARVILAGRNPRKGAESIERLRAAEPSALVDFGLLDLGSLASIEAFATKLRQQEDHLDLLVANAGVMMPPQRGTTKDGFELQFGTNYLGHFALTSHLLPLLRKGIDARVVNVTSRAYRGGKIALQDLQSECKYNPFHAYAQSKLAQLLFAQELQRRSDRAGWGIRSAAAHPGWAKTDLFSNGPGAGSFSDKLHRYVAEPLFAQTAAAGALPTLYAATAPEAAGGRLYAPRGLLELSGPPALGQITPAAADAGTAALLWKASETLSRVRFAPFAAAA